MVAGAGLASSLAAIALPSSSYTAEIAATLAVGALALLAGHTWGLLVVTAADVILLGRVWPLVFYNWPPNAATQAATYTALAGALPGLFLLRRSLPQAIELLMGPGSSPRVRSAAMVCGMLLSVCWLLLPALRPG